MNTALISKTDIEDELQITLPSTYSATMMTRVLDQAHSRLCTRTRRTTFSGNAADEAKYAEICIAIDRLATSNRDLVKLAIASISENGANISFSNGKTLASYRDEAAAIIADLTLPGSRSYSLTFADPDDEHTEDESSILY